MNNRLETSLLVRLAAIAILGLFIALAAVAYLGGRQAELSSRLLVKDVVPGTIEAHYMRMAMSRSIGWVVVAGAAETTQSRDASLKTVHDADEAFDDALKKYQAAIIINPAKEKLLLDQVQSRYEEFRKQRSTYETLILAGDRARSDAFLERELVPVYMSAVKSAEELLDYNHANSLTYANYISNSVYRLYAAVAIVMVLALISASVLIANLSIRRREMMKLSESEEKFSKAFRSNPSGVSITALETGEYLEVNESFCRIVGYSPQELIGRTSLEMRFWNSEEERNRSIRPLLDGKILRDLEMQTRICKGDPKPVLVNAERIELGGKECILALVQDLTERKRAEERVRRLVESNVEGILFWNTSGTITEANDAFLNIVGYTREDLTAGHINWLSMTPPEYAEQDEHALRELATTGVCKPYEKEYVRRDGSHVPVFVGAARFGGSSDEGVAFVLDLTERKRLEQQLLRAQRMESIGTLAGGIAHDLNNVLSPIMMAIAVLQMKSSDPASDKILEVLRSSANRGSDMVRQVLSFARGVEGRRIELQVKHLIKEIQDLVNDTFLKNIDVQLNLPYDLWTVIGDPTQIHQVLLNLCVNARDAMPEGGMLTMSAKNFTLDENNAGSNPEAKPGPYVLIQVEDTGTGIPPEVLQKIFDPFFTTKEVGKGTGLGLSTTMAIVNSHGGFIQVDSELGKGTRFSLYFPAQTEANGDAMVKADDEMPVGHGELILVIDDEAFVREIAQQTLEAFNYRVVLASEGAEAVGIYATRGTEIAAVLTDIVMPVMDGPTTIQVLRKINPDVRIIATSGLAAPEQVARAIGLGAQHFLPKPFTAESLLKMLKQVLSAEGGRSPMP